MSNARDTFLGNVRQALSARHQPGHGAGIPARGDIGYQGAGPDPLTHYCDMLKAAGGQVHVEGNAEAGVQRVLALLRERPSSRILLSRSDWLDSFGLARALESQGHSVTSVDRLDEESAKEACFEADVGISGVDNLLGETGSLVVLAKREEPRSVSLLPPLHIALAREDQLMPDLFDLFTKCNLAAGMPSCLTLITGPSKTGDIELTLVTGVHGPGEIHVVIVRNPIR